MTVSEAKDLPGGVEPLDPGGCDPVAAAAAEALERIGGPAFLHDGERFRITEMGVDIHEADLPSEESRRFGTAEYMLRSSMINYRPIHEPHPIGKDEVLADQPEMVLSLLGRKQPGDD